MEPVKSAFWKKGRGVFLPPRQKQGQQKKQWQCLFGTSNSTLGRRVYAHSAQGMGGLEDGGVGGGGGVQGEVSLKSCWEDTGAFLLQPLAWLSHNLSVPVGKCDCERIPLSPVVSDNTVQGVWAPEQVSQCNQSEARELLSESRRQGGQRGKRRALGGLTEKGRSKGGEGGLSLTGAHSAGNQRWATSVGATGRQWPRFWSRHGAGSGAKSWECFSPLALAAASSALAQRLAHDQSTRSKLNSRRTWREGGGESVSAAVVSARSFLQG